MSWLINGLLGEIVGTAIIQLVTGHNPNYIVFAIIIGVVVVCIQIIFYRVMKPQWMKIFPLVVEVGWLAWGILLEASKSVWANHYIGYPAFLFK